MAQADDVQIWRSFSITMFRLPPTALQDIYRETGIAVTLVEVFSKDGINCNLAIVYPRNVTTPAGLFEALRTIVPYAVISGLGTSLRLELLVDEQQCISLLGKNASTMRGIQFRSGCRVKISKWPFDLGDLKLEVLLESHSLNALQVAVEQIALLLAIPKANRQGMMHSLCPRVPDELTHLILCDLGVKDLTRCKLVAKEWNVNLNSLNFVEDYYDYKFAKNSGIRILYNYRQAIRAEFVDDDETPGAIWTNSELRNGPFHLKLDWPYICTSHGLICLFGVRDGVVHYICLWNPITERFRTYHFSEFLLFNEDNLGPYEAFGEGKGLYGCSYSHDDKDFVVVYIDSYESQYCIINFISVYGHTIHRRKVYLDKDFTKKNSRYHCLGASMNGSIHWLEKMEKGSKHKARVLALNLEEKSFQNLIVLPDYDYDKFLPFHLQCLDGKLSIVLNWVKGYGSTSSEVWLMNEYGNPKSWIRYTIIYHDAEDVRPLCLMKNGRIMVRYDDIDFQMLLAFTSTGTEEYGYQYQIIDLVETLTFVESLFSP